MHAAWLLLRQRHFESRVSIQGVELDYKLQVRLVVRSRYRLLGHRCYYRRDY